MILRNASQGRHLLGAGAIEQPAVLHEQREMAAPLGAVGPAVAVAGRSERERLRGAKRHAGAPFDLGTESVEPAVLDGVFQPRMFAV